MPPQENTNPFSSKEHQPISDGSGMDWVQPDMDSVGKVTHGRNIAEGKNMEDVPVNSNDINWEKQDMTGIGNATTGRSMLEGEDLKNANPETFYVNTDVVVRAVLSQAKLKSGVDVSFVQKALLEKAEELVAIGKDSKEIVFVLQDELVQKGFVERVDIDLDNTQVAEAQEVQESFSVNILVDEVMSQASFSPNINVDNVKSVLLRHAIKLKARGATEEQIKNVLLEALQKKGVVE